MKDNRRGSILVGVLILSAALSMGAGAMLIVASVWDTGRARWAENAGVFYAAESALLMGVRSLRERPPTFFDNFTASPVRLSSQDLDFMPMDGYMVQVEYTYTAASGIRALVSRATTTGGSDTVEVAWTIRGATATGGSPPSTLSLINWRESVRPYRP